MPNAKYRHPEIHSLEWTGRGRQPVWVANWINDGGTLDDLDVSVQYQKDMGSMDDMLVAAESVAGDIDLGIGDTPPKVDAETKNQNARLADLAQTVNAPLVAEQPEASQQQLEVCLQEFGFTAMTAPEFIAAGVEYINQATAYACRAGVAFWAAQEAVKNTSTPGRTQDFQDWIESAGLTKQRVYECIRIAKFYARLPDGQRQKALTIGKKHALLLAALPQEVIDQAAESGNDLIEKADMMTVAELKAEIKSAHTREKNYDAELERLRLQVDRLSKEKERTTTFLLRTEEIREECMALGLGVELNLNSLQKLFEEVNAEDTSLPEWRLQMETIWVAAHVAAARATDLIEQLRDSVAVTGMPERVMGQHALTVDEAARWVLDSTLIANRHEAQAHLRQMRREEEQPRGRGRPKGSANKVAGA